MDRIIVNARLITLDPLTPNANAFAIKNGKIEAVGETHELLKRRERNTDIVDVQGKTVVPGFIDAHSHFGPLTLTPEEIDMSDPPPPDIPTLQQRLKDAAKSTPTGAWIRAFGYGENFLAEQRHPTRWELDEAVSDHPVMLVHWGYHRVVANSMALALAGIGKGATDVNCGVIHTEESGEPNGLLTEAGTNVVMQRAFDSVIERQGDEVLDWAEANCRRHLAAGVTSIQDAWVAPVFHNLFRRAAEAGKLPLYYSPLRGSHTGLFGSPAPWLEDGAIDRAGLPSHMRLGGIKLFASGVWENVIYYSQEELNSLMSEGNAMGLTVAVHVSSDRGTEMAITAAEHASRNHLNEDAAIRLEHLFWATDSDIQRLAATGVGVVTQPAILWRFGGGRGRVAEPGQPPIHRYPLASMRAAGINVGLSSDAPCFPMEPLIGIAAAVSRRNRAGEQVAPEQAVSAEEAIRQYTLGAAWSDRTQDIEGSITAGKLANFVVLSEDPTAIEPNRIRDIQVEQTWVDGQCAFDRKSS